MLLVEVPWASRVWALPFLSALAPSERYAAQRGRRHKKITEWAWQMLLVLRRWYPHRQIVAVADRAYASLKLLENCRRLSNPITFITRLRLDAALYEPAPPRRPGQRGRPRLKGERLRPTFLTAGCIDTDLPAVRRTLGRSDRFHIESAHAHHAIRVMSTETRCERWLKTQAPFGSQPRSLTGMGVQSVQLRSFLRQPFGTVRACSPYLFGGCWCVTRKTSSKARPFCVATLRAIRRRSSPGSLCAGSSK